MTADQISPFDPKLLVDAVAHHKAGRMTEAEDLYRAVLDAAPQQTDALRLLGILYVQGNKLPQALSLLETAARMQPHNAEIQRGVATALMMQGRGYYEAGEFAQAITSFEKLLTYQAQNADAIGGIGAAYWALGNMDVAQVRLEQALALQPQDPRTITNMGELFYARGLIDAALDCYNRALLLAPTDPVILWRKSFALLALGEYVEGWALYAGALGQRDLRGPNLLAPKAPWGGQLAPDKHLLIWGEQGIGDVLQFIRYAALCKTRVGKISVFCQKPLVELLRALPFIAEVSDHIKDPERFDEHVPVMNLPHLFGTRLNNVPADIPYLSAPSQTRARWDARFTGDARPKVGLVWAGGAHKSNLRGGLIDRQRSLQLAQLRAWFDVPGVKFYSLQKDEARQQIIELGLREYLIDWMGDVENFADTAALIQNLDLVITVDTSVAHLAGALGKPVWILSRFNADWRWLQNSPKNPWYPTARIFGQPKAGDWDSVIAEVGRELALFAV